MPPFSDPCDKSAEVWRRVVDRAEELHLRSALVRRNERLRQERDLGQKKNRYAEMPEKVAELKERLRAVRVKGQVR